MSNRSGLPADVLESIKKVFFQECDDLLADLEAGLLALQRGERDPELVNSVFRAVHSIKGSAGVFGLDALARFSHLFENAMEEVRSQRQAIDADTLRTLLHASDVLTDHVRAAQDGSDGPQDSERSAEEALALLIGGREAPAEDLDFEFTPRPVAFEPFSISDPVERTWEIRFRPHARLYAKGGDPLPLLRELKRLGTSTVSLEMADLPGLDALEPEQAYLAWRIRLVTSQTEAAIHEVFEFAASDCELVLTLDENPPAPDQESPDDAMEAARGPEPRRPTAESLRVDLNRVDKLADLAGEIVITHAMLLQRVAEAGLSAESGIGMALEDLNTLTRDLRDSVMAIRAQSVKSVFQRMSRLVREVEAATGKQVELTVFGEGTEVDRTVIDRLTDPLTHLIRNAIDHGLETPAARAAAGKPAIGTLRLSAAHRAGRIVIEVADDGAGIDRPRVKSIAAARGLISAETQLQDDELDNLIFLPGFSTAATVSDLSGRGVGLDVVKRNVQAIGGRITLVSQPGKGSTFTLSLPLTLAVLDGMVFSLAGQRLVVPVGVLLESIQPRATDIHVLGPDVRLLSYRGEQVPFIDLGWALGYTGKSTDFTNGVALLVENESGRRAALLIDSILDQRQVVIKSLEANYGPTPSIAAATILGDGRVALILDVDAIMASQGQASEAFQQLAQAG